MIQQVKQHCHLCNLISTATLTQEFIKIKLNKEDDREAMLVDLCSRVVKTKTIIFFPHKKTAHRMKLIFAFAGLSATELHGNLSQTQVFD